ncbi:MAG: hypothetical protein QXS81_04690 [Candidatus Micrarchaeaceae archaeon]
MEGNEKFKLTNKELEFKLKLFLEQYKHKINSEVSFNYFLESIKPYLPIPAIGYYIAIDGVNTSGKTTTAELLRLRLAEKGYEARNIKTISDLNTFGREFYKEKWNKAYEIDPFLISSSTYLQVLKNTKPNPQTFVLLDRYIFSAEVFLEAAAEKENSNIEKYVKNWFNAFNLPMPFLQVVLIDSKVDYLARFKVRYGRIPSETEKEFYNITKELFLNNSKTDKSILLINTSNLTQKEVIYSIESRLNV